jgi:hypothetical protein
MVKSPKPVPASHSSDYPIKIPNSYCCLGFSTFTDNRKSDEITIFAGSEITYLNHGSFGACPKPIFENYQHWQLELEKEPVQFLTKKLSGHLKESKNALAAYIGCAPEDFFCTQSHYGHQYDHAQPRAPARRRNPYNQP